MKKRGLFLVLTGSAIGLLMACNNDKPAVYVAPQPVKPVLMPPFRYHKLVEVSPGEDYDVVSWGRGSTKTGSFAILHSDSAAAKYITTTGDLAGSIVDVFNTDMDLDGNPEIIIEAKGIDTNNYVNMYAFEYTNGHANKIDFPKLTKSQRQGYKGQDNFYVQEGKLLREFPLFDADGKPNGQKRQLEYGMYDNSFTVKQISKDSTNAAASAKPVVKPSENKPKSTSHSTGNRHKKKHHRHHSGE